MTNEVIIRCQKTPEVGIRRVPAYPNTHLELIKNLGGAGQDLGGLCPSGPSLKPPLYRHCESSPDQLVNIEQCQAAADNFVGPNQPTGAKSRHSPASKPHPPPPFITQP